MSLKQYNAMQMCRIPCTTDKEQRTEKMATLSLKQLKDLVVIIWTGCINHEWIQAAPVS